MDGAIHMCMKFPNYPDSDWGPPPPPSPPPPAPQLILPVASASDGEAETKSGEDEIATEVGESWEITPLTSTRPIREITF